MRTFEIELNGFVGSTDVTDNLIKWILAPDENAARVWASHKQWVIQEFREIDIAPVDPRYRVGFVPTMDMGLDAILIPLAAQNPHCRE